MILTKYYVVQVYEVLRNKGIDIAKKRREDPEYFRKRIRRTVREPEELDSNVVFSSPHSGSRYPPSLLRQTRLGAVKLRASEDAFVDELMAIAPSAGAPLLAATYSRVWVDLNRGPNELDPALIAGARNAGHHRIHYCNHPGLIPERLH